MARIHVLSEHVANKIAAGEVVERPASVVKELLENALDAGATRIRVDVEGGGRKLVRVQDNGAGMVRDDAMLAFERHATSKIKDAEDLLNISTLGFRGEGLPAIASVARVLLETAPGGTQGPLTTASQRSASARDHQPEHAPAKDPCPERDLQLCHSERALQLRESRNPYPEQNLHLCRGSLGGTRIEIAGGKLLKVEEAGLAEGTSITVRDLFFNTPARKKFLKAESTELSHIASLVTHYALAHPEKHIELHSATQAMLIAAPVKSHSERIYQLFGKETLDQLVPLAAELDLERVGIPGPPPWRREEEYEAPAPGKVRLHGYVSKPEIQKLNRNSIFIFVNGRLVRDRLVQHALTEAYRNILPPAVFPVVLLFIEMPPAEVDCNVHPSKTEVRFRQQAVVHDFVRDSVRAALMKARPVPQFAREIAAQPTAAQALTPGAMGPASVAAFELTAPALPPVPQRLEFEGGIPIEANAAVAAARMPGAAPAVVINGDYGDRCAPVISDDDVAGDLTSLATLRPLGQVRASFILAVNEEGLWIIDQHVAHERVLFERLLRQRDAERVEGQRLLMPLVIELTPGQQAIFTGIAEELRANGFEVEPFGSRTIAVKTAPAGVEAGDIERLLHELLELFEREQQTENLEKVRHRIAASIACHAAIKVNMPLEPEKIEWLLAELARTDFPFSCPHGRPVVLRYSLRDIQKAFKRV